MKERFVAYVFVRFNQEERKWFGEEFEMYPTEEQLKKVWDDKKKDNVKRHYINVERQVRFED